jgi:hypothetical protein
MKIFIPFLSLLLSTSIFGQDLTDLDKYSMDTVNLSSFSSKKTISLTHNNLIFYLGYEEYKFAVNGFTKAYWRRDKNRLQRVISTLKSAKKQLQKSDTAYLTQQDFDNIGIQLMEKFIATQIDNKKCLITDANKFLQSFIIRVKGSFNRGVLNAWEGRRYYLPKQEKHFLMITTSIT